MRLGHGHLSLVMLFVGVGLNSLVDPSIDCSCWHVRLVMGLSWRGERAGPWGSQVPWFLLQT